MSRDEAEIAAMMIPCQWHHTLKYLFKEILQFVFHAFISSSRGAVCERPGEMLNVKHAKYYGWLTSRTLLFRWDGCDCWNRIRVSAICQTLRSNHFGQFASERNSEVKKKLSTTAIVSSPVNLSRAWKVTAFSVFLLSEGAINCKTDFFTTRGFFDINNSSS